MKSSKMEKVFSITVKTITSVLLLMFFIYTSGCNISNSYDVSDGDDDLEDADGDNDLDGFEDENEIEAEEEEPPYDTTQLWLNETLEEGTSRAGLIRTQEELLTGDEATGELGDYKMYNEKVAVIISQIGQGKILSSFGGAIIDAARLRENKQVAGDQLKEAFPIIGVTPRFLPLDGGISQFKAMEITLIHNGSDGRAAHIRVTGTDAPFLFMTSLVEAPKFPNPSIDVTIDYYLDADADFVRVESRVTMNDEAEENIKEVIRTGMAVFTSDKLEPFYPNMEFSFTGETAAENDSENLWQHLIDFYAYTSPDVSYAVSDGNNQKTFAMLSPYKLLLAFCPKDTILSESDNHKYEQIFYIGESSAAKMTDQIVAHNLALMEEDSESGMVKISGTVEDFENWEDKNIEVLAVLVEDVTPKPTEDGDEDSQEIEKVYKYYYQNKAYPNENGEYEFSVPAGTYMFMADTHQNYYKYNSTYNVQDEGFADVDIPTPGEPHYVSFNVRERLPDTDAVDFPYITARIEFYEGDYSVDDEGKITYNFGDLLATAYSDESGQVTTEIPMGARTTLTYTAVAHLNNLYNVDMETEQNVTSGETSVHNFILEKVVDTAYTAGENTYNLHSLNFDMKSDRSLDTKISMRDKVIAAKAAGFDITTGSDMETVSDYSTLTEEMDLLNNLHPLFIFPGLRINPSWSNFLGVNVSKPEEAQNYYDIQLASFTSTGSYTGRRPAPGIWSDMRDMYESQIIQINTPRGVENSFFDYFAKDEYEDGYDPAVGVASLKYEASSTLNDWDTMELLNPNIKFVDSMQILQDWLSLLEQGIYKPITASSSVHSPNSIANGRMGYARTMIYSDLKNYNKYNVGDALELAKKGQSFVTTGPIIKLSVDGAIPGMTVVAPETEGEVPTLKLSMQVLAPEWMPVYAVFTCVDGSIVLDYHNWVGKAEGVLRYDYSFPVGPITNTDENPTSKYKDTYIVAMALHNAKNSDKTPADPGYPVFSISNPVFIEADGVEGFRTPLDMETVQPQSDYPYCMSLTLCNMIYSYYDGEWNKRPKIINDCRSLYCEDNPNQGFCQN